LPSSSSSLQHHHRKRQQHIAIVFFFSNIEKTKHTEKQQKKPKERKELTFKLSLCPLTFGSCVCPPIFAFLFQVLSLGIFLFSSRRGKKNIKKKNQKEENICREGKELTFKLLLYPFTFGSCFCLPTFALLFQVFSHGIFFFSSRRKKKHTKKRKTIEKKKYAKKGFDF